MSMPGTTRRDFLRTAVSLAGVAGLGGVAGCPGDPLFGDDGFAATAVLKARAYDERLWEVVEEGMRLIPPPDVRGKRVLLKANFVDLPRAGRPVVTNPMLLGALVEAFRGRGAAEVLIGDGPALQRDAYEILDAAGMTPLLDELGIRFVDLNLDDLVRLPNAGNATGLSELYLAATAYHADVLVSVPKMKTHHWAGVSLAMKGMFGIMPAAVYGWPRNRFHRHDPHHAVFDFNRTRSPDYCIIDGVMAMEGNGPIQGTPREMGVLVFGDNATAVDATACRVMGLRPERIGYLQKAAGVLGPVSDSRIEQRGEPLASVAASFAVVDHFAWLRA